ncbi:MAG: threonine aldolase family protein, partial [Bacteroidales bacterium]
NAAATLDVSLYEMTVGCGIDILSFGGTKNGMMMGECVVILNPILQPEARFVRKQTTQLASKMRYLACQFSAYFENDLWLANARHANRMAKILNDSLSEYPQIRFTQPVESNVMFLEIPKNWADELLKEYFFYFWNEKQGEIRLVTSFDTNEADVAQFIDRIAELAKKES